MNEKVNDRQVMAYSVGEEGPNLVCVDCVRTATIHAMYFYSKYMMEILGGENCDRCARSLGAVTMDYRRSNVYVTPAAAHSQLHLDLLGTDSSVSTSTVPERTDD